MAFDYVKIFEKKYILVSNDDDEGHKLLPTSGG